MWTQSSNPMSAWNGRGTHLWEKTNLLSLKVPHPRIMSHQASFTHGSVPNQTRTKKGLGSRGRLLLAQRRYGHPSQAGLRICRCLAATWTAPVLLGSCLRPYKGQIQVKQMIHQSRCALEDTSAVWRKVLFVREPHSQSGNGLLSGLSLLLGKGECQDSNQTL